MANKDDTLQEWLAKLQGTKSSTALQRLAGISLENARIVEVLLDTAKKANDKGQKAIAKEIMEAIGSLIENNKDLQEVVREIRPKID